MTENADISWNFGRGFIWSSIEPSLGIISACLPTLRPLIRSIFPAGFGRSTKSKDFYRLQDRSNFTPGTDGMAPKNDIRRASQDSTAPLETKDGIMVRRELLWSSKPDATENAVPEP